MGPCGPAASITLVEASLDDTLPPRPSRIIKNALRSLPSYAPDRGYKQPKNAIDHHRFVVERGWDAIDLLRIGGDALAQDLRDESVDWNALREMRLARH